MNEINERIELIEKLTAELFKCRYQLEIEKKHSAQLVNKIKKMENCEDKLKITIKALKNISFGGMNIQMYADKTLEEIGEE